MTATKQVLQLGAGMRPMDGATNHDRIAHAPWIAIAHNLNLIPWPWDDAAWDEVVALDVCEHLTLPVQAWLDECWRILRPDGQLVLRLPAWDNPVSHRDVTHQRLFHEESFHYWWPDHALWQNYGHFYYAESARWWTVERVERVNPDPRYGIGDLGFVLRKRT